MKVEKGKPLIPASKSLPELTFRAIVIAIVLALLLAASNTYLALKIGTTISASIPASVLALGILRFFKNSNVLESNIIQTAASAGEGVAAAVAFILPAMLVLHIWNGFSYWETTIVSLLGGLLGVLFSVPLRRVMLNLPTLRFPEGTAIGNVLISAAKKGSSLKYLVQGGAVGALISFCQSGLKVIGDTLEMWYYTGKSIVGMGIGLTPATLAAGYIIGIQVGITLLVGLVIGWCIALPLLAHYIGFSTSNSAYDSAMSLWSSHLRFIGVGNMLVGGVWTLIRLINPVIAGLKTSFTVLKVKTISSSAAIKRTERDISISWVISGSAVLAALVFVFLLYHMYAFKLVPFGIGYFTFASLCLVIFVVIIGFFLATICAYFAGLVGSTNNPLSGLLIIGLLLLSLLIIVLFNIQEREAYVAGMVILVATIIATVAAISNENLQDLKAGQMVGATPWKQQLMLAVGVVVSTLVIGPVLNLLFNAYGMAGVYPRPGMNVSQMLGAPQASLMAAVVNGVLTRNLDWSMILIGCGIAVVIIAIDEIIKKWGYRLPALAVGLGIYLPPDIISPIIIGGVISYLVKRAGRKFKQEKRDEGENRGVLLACGMVAGSALMGVILAIPFVLMGSAEALAIVPKSFSLIASLIGVGIVIALCVWIYKTASVTRSKGD